MARYTPRDPGFTRSPTLGDAIASLATSAGGGQIAGERRRQDDEDREFQEERRDVAREDRELDLFEQGFTRDPRTETVPDQEDVTLGARVGMAGQEQARVPDIFEQAGIGLQRGNTPAAGALGEIAQGGAPEPQVLAIPGAYVEGLGFTPRPIHDTDLVDARQAAARRQRERLAPGVERATDDYFFDERLSPQGRADARQDERDTTRRSRLEAVLEAVGRGEEDLPPEIMAEGLELGLSERFLRGEQGGASGDDTIRVQGRTFPNTEAGQRAALAWREAVAEAGRSGSGTGAGARVTGETTKRTLAMAAARALDSIRGDFRDMSPFEQSRVPAGFMESQIRETLELFGFESVDELQTEMRNLRLVGLGGQGGQPTGQGDELTDEQIDAIIQQNPDATPEEILELIGRGGG